MAEALVWDRQDYLNAVEAIRRGYAEMKGGTHTLAS